MFERRAVHRGSAASASPRPKARAVRIVGLALLALIMALVPLQAGANVAGGPEQPCEPGMNLVGQWDNSFTWIEGGLSLRAVDWSGFLQLREELNSDCYVVGVELDLSGPLLGGTLVATGPLFVSYTVQHPDPFSDYGNVGTNAYGDLLFWSPNTEGLIDPHFDINDRGADEWFVQVTGPATVSGVVVGMSLPLELVGQTIEVQMHVGYNLCKCKVTEIFVPGETPPPPPPPPPPFDFSLAVDPSEGTVVPGDSANADAAATLVEGDPNIVSFEASGLPPDSTASFDPASCVPTCTSTMTITTSTGTPTGTYTIDVLASDGNIVRGTAYTLTVEEAPPPAQVWGVYVHAHADDWQLFESPNGFFEYHEGQSLLFILATAGDAGQGASYWQAREEATMASVHFLVGPNLPEEKVALNVCHDGGVCHTIAARTYGNTVSVFMRLPDGGLQGGGFPSHQQESLSKLRDGLIPTITAVDGSTTYTGWGDFTSTLSALISLYTPYNATTRVNAPDFDRDAQTTHVDICPDCPDHADHLAVADAVYAITIGAGAPWSRRWYIDYPIAWGDPRYPVNLDEPSYQVKRALFMAYNEEQKVLTGVDEYNQMPWFWENCFHRNYFREA